MDRIASTSATRTPQTGPSLAHVLVELSSLAGSEVQVVQSHFREKNTMVDLVWSPTPKNVWYGSVDPGSINPATQLATKRAQSYESLSLSLSIGLSPSPCAGD